MNKKLDAIKEELKKEIKDSYKKFTEHQKEVEESNPTHTYLLVPSTKSIAMIIGRCWKGSHSLRARLQ